ncbi:uncharacterized protein YndB with AHSA1/START domain [Caulobacter ginsengisoli]|uniref:Uncharacterized protein YndB with AHSA1/START domain n=1 Tax=Caulobacter ginsengisoli TaxID=400775 RepID=A0ABU0IUT2_9CAUL|nr:SRPBCC domain-containing protein [Caulobacter ginsengisoli]MDQ0465772.1 uncharacterized protein YndB with AHSA1/START domain [Caulobacter ginsengisoli]
MPDILHRLTVPAPRAWVHSALTTGADVRQWWTRDADLDAGGGEVRFFAGSRVTRLGVEALEPPGRLVWRVLDSNLPGWRGTWIEFDLEDAGEASVIAFSHRGWAAADEAYARTTTGWAQYLFSLQRYLETGTGAPHGGLD